MNILEKEISYFKDTKSTECISIPRTIESFLEGIKTGEFKEIVDKVRSAKDKNEKDFWKTKLPTISFHGIFDGFRNKKSFIEASGLIILDIDDIEDDLNEVKDEIINGSEHVLAVMISPGGKGIKVLYYVLPELITANSYREIGKSLVNDFDIYGKVDYLSITDTLIATYDSEILINNDAVPDFVYIKEIENEKFELEELDSNKVLWTNVEDFFDTVLAVDIASKTNNNYHYIQVAILDLAKFGFRHPEEDLSFIIDYAESEFKHSKSNKERFDRIVEISKDYPQKKWPYKLISKGEEEEEEEEYFDYSEYATEKDSTESEEDENLFINTLENSFYKKVLDTVNEGDRVGFEVSYKDLSDIIRFKGTGLFTFTGIPGHGKTEMLDAITLDLARLYGHQTLVAGFEQSPEEHIVKLIRRFEGKDIRCKTWINNKKNEERLKKLYTFVTDKIIHLDTNKTGGNINSILEAFAKKISDLREKGKNPRYVVLDPFNMLSIKGRFSGHEKIEEILRRLTHFSHQMNILVFLVAHPFKMKKDEKTGIYEVPDFYSVKGSSAFFEMSYHGAVVYRLAGTVMFRVLKVKQNNLGTAGESTFFLYERGSGRYLPCDEDGNELSGTHREKDWLEQALKLENNNYKLVEK